MFHFSENYGSLFCNPYTLNSSSLVSEKMFSDSCDSATQVCNEKHDPLIEINSKCVYEEMRKFHWCRNGTDTIRESLVIANAQQAQVRDGVIMANTYTYDVAIAKTYCFIQCYLWPDEEADDDP